MGVSFHLQSDTAERTMQPQHPMQCETAQITTPTYRPPHERAEKAPRSDRGAPLPGSPPPSVPLTARGPWRLCVMLSVRPRPLLPPPPLGRSGQDWRAAGTHPLVTFSRETRVCLRTTSFFFFFFFFFFFHARRPVSPCRLPIPPRKYFNIRFPVCLSEICLIPRTVSFGICLIPHPLFEEKGIWVFGVGQGFRNRDETPVPPYRSGRIWV